MEIPLTTRRILTINTWSKTCSWIFILLYVKKYKPRYYTPQEIDFKGHPFVGVEWPITGSTGNAYGVEMTEQGFVCNCIGFAHHGKCKHSREVADKLCQ